MKGDEAFLRKVYKSLHGMFGGNNTTADDTPAVKDESVVKSVKDEQLTTILKAVDVEKRLCTEIVYKPIIKDVHGEWMSAETIVAGEESFRKNLEAGIVKANLFHITNTEKFTISKSWVATEDLMFEGRDEVVEKGTWLAETHYEDDSLWEMKKSGELGGLSLGGFGSTDDKTGEITNLRFSKDEFKAALLAMHNQKES